MERVFHIQQLLLRSKRWPWLILGVTLAILAGIILLASLQLRQRIREQIAGRDGEILHAVTLMQQLEDEQAGSIAEPANQLFIILKTSRLNVVLAARLFSAEGRFAEVFPVHVREANLDAADLPALKRLKPVSHFHPSLAISDIFYPDEKSIGQKNQAVPILEVNVPLHGRADTALVGIAQFLISGHGIAAEYRQLDRHLLFQGLAAFLAGGGLAGLTIGFAFRRLRQAHKLLAERTKSLLQANQELALAAKTSAVGAVSAHLIHGLKNPLFGLQNYVTNLEVNDPERPDWQQAIALTRRMQNLIHEVSSVLREEEATSQYEITLAEVVESIATRVQPLVRETGVQFLPRLQGEGALPNRTTNLLILVLLNLVHNALEATPKGGAVHFSVSRQETDFVFAVRDEGPGIPEGLPLFQPCRSSKDGGSGLGLAISKQLANHLGARLDLKANGPEGCTFEVKLPVNRCVEKVAPALSFPG